VGDFSVRPNLRLGVTIAVMVVSIVALAPLSSASQPFPPYYGRGFRYEASVRIQVTPKETEVYVDGFLVGRADDFDGFAQRLRVDRGEHVVEFYLKGHRSFRQLLYFQPGETYRLRHIMQPLAAGEAEPTPPTPATTARGSTAASGLAGTLTIRVQPADAVVLIDGERWQPSAPGERLQVHVNPGPHRIEVQKDGYRSFSMDVIVRPGQTTPINVSLSPLPDA
jgi:hypothetical protein